MIVFDVTKKNFTMSALLKENSLPPISSNHSYSGRSGASGAATTFVSLCAQQLCPVQKMWYLTALLPILWPLHSFCPFSMTFLTLAWASFMCKCQLVPEKEQRQSGFWRPKFGTDTHHCVFYWLTQARGQDGFKEVGESNVISSLEQWRNHVALNPYPKVWLQEE